MLRAESPSSRTAYRPGRAAAIGAGAVVLAWLALTACDDQSAAPQKAAQTSNSASDLFGAPAKAPPLPPPPSDDEGSSARGPASSEQPALAPVLDPAVASECKALREKESAMRAQADDLRVKRVAPATDAYEKAYEAFSDCQQDFSCANNEGRYASLGSTAQRAEAAMEKEEEGLMTVEGELHDVSQTISVKCGDF